MSSEQAFGQEFDQPEEGALQKEPDMEFDEEAKVAADAVDFEEPAEDSGTGETAEMEQVQLLEVPEGLQEIFDGIEGALYQQGYPEEGAVQAEDAYEGMGNIVGVGFGVPEDISSTGSEPGEPTLNVYVAERASVDEVKAVIVDSMGVSAASSDDVAVNVIVTGELEAFPHKFKIRPAPGGVSVGHYRITAGTLGCLARGNRPPRNQRLMILSNNHVLANSNNARFGDSIIQPGRADGGVSPRDRIAILERYVPIRFGAGKVNYVDCATGWAWPSRVRKELVYLYKGQRRFFRISSKIKACRKGLLVGKSGRTTQLTVGRIVDCNFSGWVGYRPQKAFFRDQMVITSAQQGRSFSAGGDSGSVIWTWDRTRNPVGLLFAGGGGYTIANKMWRVLKALDIQLYT
jgi:hypothetical protein